MPRQPIRITQDQHQLSDAFLEALRDIPSPMRRALCLVGGTATNLYVGQMPWRTGPDIDVLAPERRTRIQIQAGIGPGPDTIREVWDAWRAGTSAFTRGGSYPIELTHENGTRVELFQSGLVELAFDSSVIAELGTASGVVPVRVASFGNVVFHKIAGGRVEFVMRQPSGLSISKSPDMPRKAACDLLDVGAIVSRYGAKDVVASIERTLGFRTKRNYARHAAHRMQDVNDTLSEAVEAWPLLMQLVPEAPVEERNRLHECVADLSQSVAERSTLLNRLEPSSTDASARALG